MGKRFILGLLTVSLGACATTTTSQTSPQAGSPLMAQGLSAEEKQARQLVQIQSTGNEIVRLYRMEQYGEDPGYSPAARRARQAALRLDFDHCTKDYTTVALEGDSLGGPGPGLIAVYLIPEPENADLVPIGGFYRVLVDSESGDVTHFRELGNGCRTLSLNPTHQDGASVSSLLVNHNFTPYPLENHVFASMTYEVDLVVMTNGVTWKVDNGRIWALD
ncbi:hypothetical protein [Parvularcula sp. LCG005]|uniref:hypothetical protein n=1 Tax=Parvularcula sp. LCG005 TaxID=3078805 RepID=UPI00294241B7|nr:hypothetical protein [Parvularcula sp. LCG005]WOI54602.1 hypothetical protein RUI03_06285 [Parvularcula sp. LCG005]